MSDRCASVRCRDEGRCGCDLLKSGWKLQAHCDDHPWSYLVSKDKAQKECAGINALGGPEEYACKDFSGSVAKFARCKNKNDL